MKRRYLFQTKLPVGRLVRVRVGLKCLSTSGPTLSERKMRNKPVVRLLGQYHNKSEVDAVRCITWSFVRRSPGSTRPELFRKQPKLPLSLSFALAGLERALGLGYLYSLERR